MAFIAGDHMRKLKGQDYLEVKWRLVWLRDEHRDWEIDTECQERDEEHAVFRAVIRDGEGRQIASAHGSETKRDFGDYYEKAETKAVGRALAYAGYGTQYVGEELDEGERIVDSPVERNAPAEAPKTASPKQVEILARYYTGDKLAQLLAYNNVSRLEDLPMAKASELIAAITKITERRSAQ